MTNPIATSGSFGAVFQPCCGPVRSACQNDTPVGTYNPDWALAYKNDQVLYFVAETKNTGGSHVDLGLLRPIEDLRIECGRRHFRNFEEVRFRVVGSLEELVDSQETKLKKTDLITKSSSFFVNAWPARGLGMLSSYHPSPI